MALLEIFFKNNKQPKPLLIGVFKPKVKKTLLVFFALPLVICLIFLLIRKQFPQFPLLEYGYLLVGLLICIFLLFLLFSEPLRKSCFKDDCNLETIKKEIFKLLFFSVLTVVFFTFLIYHEILGNDAL